MAIVLLETTEIEMAEVLHVMLGTISILILRTFFQILSNMCFLKFFYLNLNLLQLEFSIGLQT